MSRPVSTSTLALLGLALTACGGERGGPIDTRAMLRDLVDIVILPTYAELETEAARLSRATADLCAAPDATKLSEAREAWRAVRVPWQRAEAFAFGPVMDLRVDGAVDFWPLRRADADEALADDQPVTDMLIEASGSGAKGMPVMEYLLFDPSADDAAILARLAGGMPAGRNCDYLAALGRDVAKRATEVHLAWSPEGGDFGNTLASAGIGTGRYRKLQDALAEVVDELIQLSQTMEGMKLAAPLGRRDGGIPQPDAAEAPLAYNGRADLLANLDGLEAVYRVSLDGKTGVSLYQDTANRQPGLHEALDRQLTVCRATLVEIDEPIPVLVTSGRTEGLEAAFLCHQELLRMLQTDLAGVLGVTPTFGESDGD